MIEYSAPKSKCRLCEKEFSKGGMGRHLASCLKKQFAACTGKTKRNYDHVSVTTSYKSDYFLHLLVPENAALGHIDRFLRDIWLECCGHMSAFSYGRYGEGPSMSTRLDSIAEEGTVLNYQYDFGSPTELTVKFIKRYQVAGKKSYVIELLSKNSQLIIPCDECGKFPAVRICTECSWDGEGWLCEKCAKNHECDEEMFLPVVNSPRSGVCGYDGPADEDFGETSK